ncbi:HAD family hydrolase [Micromonosporaceae bacterium Da 78-11]
MVVSTVIFDVGGVLARTGPMDFALAWETRLGLSEGAIGVRLADVWAAGAIGRMTEAEVGRAVRDRLGLTAEQADAMLADMWVQYLGVANTELIGYARTLRPAYRTAILSNSFVGAREREQRAYGLGDLVDDLIYSHEVGLNKPDPRLWELACRRLGAQPGGTVFVDNAPRLVASAREFGLRAVLFETTAQTITDVEALLAEG